MSTSHSVFPKITPLTTVNYQAWKVDVEFVLREKKLWRIVSGLELSPVVASPETATAASSAPAAPPSAELLAWMEKADQAIGIIGRLMSENIRHVIEPYTEDPAAAWNQLRERFGKNTPANIRRLRTQFSTLKFDSSKGTMADHLERLQQLAYYIGQAERPLLPSELATAMILSMPYNFAPTIERIYAVDKGIDPVYIYSELIDEEQRQNAGKPQSGSNNKSKNALKASHRVTKSGDKSGDTRKCFNCNRPGHFAKECRSKKRRNDNSSNHDNNFKQYLPGPNVAIQ